ncbi:phosphate/phosphite/phosphonate ABC transporter substrate-binding protein [Desulfobaculum bizertense]|uniref:Phosphonate transport system substrate-binding protein n=1 Tax=Desulfobaculum bizertense DSM 18034 TaxID=1121442 RepID=A0A1T4VX19_9BACT|nr:phosphate/phosphite/phosphonate ABC transporter substrate-binding protein [Desulfobaculum bizertense]UIJ36829.1 phosphate/phosphite/phosphonate ABC transporter substrate-binding protein [Desulfobaculum bizertense]SKA69449.1 phosphonate transport system substrate-binding protein [Desulfobaculum bizertense DSM 18034]
MAKRFFSLVMIMMMAVMVTSAFADDCLNRGQLDEMYCDNDGDLCADAPTDESKFRDPSTLVFTYTPVEDPAVYQDAFSDFQRYLEKATGKRVIYYTVQSNAAEVEAMRSGRLHIAGFSTGPTGFAVNLAGFVPMAVKGYPDGFQGYNLIMVVRADSPYKSLKDLKGKVVAHTAASSNSGNLAPRALFPKLGLVPDKDYRVVYSGKHDQSIMGVLHGDYDAAPVASDVFTRMAEAGRIDSSKFRIIYRSAKFPTSAFGYAHDLKPELVQKIIGAFNTYRFTPEMQKTFKGADRFYPVTYMADWKVIRDIAESTGVYYNKAGLKKMAAKEAAKRAKKK